MDKSTKEAIGFCDANAASCVAGTAGVELARHLSRGGRVLDLGCESGRAALDPADDYDERHSGRLSRPFQGQGRKTPTQIRFAPYRQGHIVISSSRKNNSGALEFPVDPWYKTVGFPL